MQTVSLEAKLWFGVPLALILVVAAAPAWSQNRFDIQRFHPLPSQQVNCFGVASALVLEHGDWEAGFTLDYANDPLVLWTEADERAGNLISGLLTVNLMGALGLFDWFEVGAAIPVILMQDGEDVSEIEYVHRGGFNIGDIRLVPRFLLFTQRRDDEPAGLAVGLLAALSIPTGSDADFQGEDFRVEPRLVLDYGFDHRLRISANAGYLIRPDADFINVEVTDALTYGLALDLVVTPSLHIMPEVAGQVSVLADDIDTEELPLEVLFGLKFYPIQGLLVESGAGMGLVEGFGTPDWRAFLGLSYSPPPVGDSDGDGFFDDVDGCILDPEDFDGFEDIDGCSDPDNDSDTLLDAVDDCPLQPEDFDGFEDIDGCPDPDNDSDGLPDAEDQCLNRPEDFDGFEDIDGCPDPDNDQDGLSDIEDECPNEPESINGYEDSDGCPDSPPLIEEAPCQRINLRDRIYFDTGSDRIQERSFPLLDQVVGILTARSDLRLIRVEGHTDDRGSDSYNLDLSQRRAESVVNYLVSRGVEPLRFRPVGFGESQPIADNRTAEGRAGNRRVEFIILEQDGCEEIVPPY